MMSAQNRFNDDIDWGVYKKQQTPVQPSQEAGETSMYRQNFPLGQKPGNEKVKTFLSPLIGDLPANMPEFKLGSPESQQIIREMIEWGAGAPGVNVLKRGAKIAKPLVEKGVEYLHPEKSAEEFRSTLGEGTSRQNIENLAKRVELGEKSAQEEALIPKKELYRQEGRSNIFNVKSESLPEGNLPKMAEMIAPGEKFSESQQKALISAIKNYRKSGNYEQFIEHAEDIFGVPELSAKQAEKVEDALMMPTKRGSQYLADKEVAEFYSKKSKIMQLHNAFEKKPTLSNYDALQSELKREARRFKHVPGAEAKYDALMDNIKRLNEDKEAFMQTLPDKMKNLENEFRQKWRTGAVNYEEAGEVIDKLRSGASQELSDADIVRTFSKPNKYVKEILKDMGASATQNILYSALQHVKPGDYKAIADTILDLKRTKGFDEFISPEMEQFAKKLKLRGGIRKGLVNVGTSGAGALAGGMMAGPVGMIAGAGAPLVWSNREAIAKMLGKVRKT